MGKPVVITYPAASTTALAASQSPTSGVALVLGSVTGTDIQRTITITSTSNLSGINFVITGQDTSGNTVTETLAGPNNATATSANQYLINTAKLTIVPNGTNAGTLTVGTGNAGSTRWVGSNLHISPFNETVAVGQVSGTISATVQDTPDEVNATAVGGTATPQTFNHPTIATISAATESNYAFPARYVRCIAANTTTGSFNFYVIQAGLGGA